MSAVAFRSISRVYGDCVALKSVTAEFESGKIHAILGENGAGKSTLMRILFGLQEPSGGEVLIGGKLRAWSTPAEAIANGLGMVQQHFTLVPTLTVIENIMLGSETLKPGLRLDRNAAISLIESRLPSRSLAVDWNRRVSDLSVGEQQRVEILKLIFRDAKILVLDEPTAVLTPSEIEELFKILKLLRERGRTIFVITHKLKEVFAHCDTWTVLRAGESCGQGQIAGTSVETVVRAMVGSDVPPLRARAARAPGETVLSVDFSEGHGGWRGSLRVREGEIVGIAGVDGSGQAELVDAICGICSFDGEIKVGGMRASLGRTREIRESGVALIPEDRHHQALWLAESVELNAVLGFEDKVSRSQWRATALKWLKEFDVRFPSMATAVSRLSGGNQQKLIYAREFSGRRAKLILCHQPTRGVDLAAVHAIHTEIIKRRDEGAAILLISSELDELLALSDRITAMASGRFTGEFTRAQGAEFSREEIGRAMLASGGAQ